jgi:hypothetical protein
MSYKVGDRVEVYAVCAWMSGRIASEYPGYWTVRLDVPIPAPTSQMGAPKVMENEWIAWKSNPNGIRLLTPPRAESDHPVEEVAEALYVLFHAEREADWRAQHGIPETTTDGACIGLSFVPFTESDRRPAFLAAAEKVVAALGRVP